MAKRYYPVDANLLFCEDKTIAASTVVKDAATNDVVLTIGAGQQDFAWVVDIETIEVDTNNEKYDFLLQGSNSPTFASGIVNLAQMTLGAAAVLLGSAGVSVPGRYALHTDNEFANLEYKYVRVNLIIAGTIATGVKFSSWLSARAH